VPTYQYVCTACGDPHEAVQSFSDPSLTECPSCGGELRKVFSAVGVVFKGSGFYRNDSRSAAKAGASSSSSESASSGSSGSSDSGSSKGSAEKGSGATSSGDKASAGSGASTASKSAAGSSSSAA